MVKIVAEMYPNAIVDSILCMLKWLQSNVSTHFQATPNYYQQYFLQFHLKLVHGFSVCINVKSAHLQKTSMDPE